ncbi:hypothetical protein PMW_173 [Pseudomonas phage phiPMW]|uniref:Uncharacterized protein n=1 Tax=Pseudomonas phage phiPMW TaxID=1815582 RepID=A0A1S5R1P9_9CAUD|nr:hypothetical protein FDG97_gp177 [Pseudomonas phage phiPMW]ANA49298.1 hypothetical protein PMW_173 [Pseudomonas phage phiPMW]
MYEIKRTQSGYYYIEKDGQCIAGGMNKNDATIRYNEIVQMSIAEKFKWRPIEELPDVYRTTRRMFVVRGELPYGKDQIYKTDPYCVWLSRNNTEYLRWPHDLPPTEFMELPE